MIDHHAQVRDALGDARDEAVKAGGDPRNPAGLAFDRECRLYRGSADQPQIAKFLWAAFDGRPRDRRFPELTPLFDPPAPPSAGEFTTPGWQMWTKTWCLDFVSTFDIYWSVPQGPLDVKGPDAARLLSRVAARDVERRMTQDGRVLYTSLCNESGGMIDDLTVYRLGAEHFWVIATPSRAAIVQAWLERYSADMAAYIRKVVEKKESRHHIGEPDFQKPSRSMVHIGG